MRSPIAAIEGEMKLSLVEVLRQHNIVIPCPMRDGHLIVGCPSNPLVR
jgi:hypothetical protein